MRQVIGIDGEVGVGQLLGYVVNALHDKLPQALVERDDNSQRIRHQCRQRAK
jgi:hypothetical protein